jgi:hypothetical protein
VRVTSIEINTITQTAPTVGVTPRGVLVDDDGDDGDDVVDLVGRTVDDGVVSVVVADDAESMSSLSRSVDGVIDDN